MNRRDRPVKSGRSRVRVKAIRKRKKLVRRGETKRRRRPDHRPEKNWPNLANLPWAGYCIKTTVVDGHDELALVPANGNHLNHEVPEHHRLHVTFGASPLSVEPVTPSG